MLCGSFAKMQSNLPSWKEKPLSVLVWLCLTCLLIYFCGCAVYQEFVFPTNSAYLKDADQYRFHSDIYRFADKQSWQNALVPFTKIRGKDIWHYRAVAGNSTANVSWDIVSVTGIWHRRYRFSRVICCMRFRQTVVSAKILIHTQPFHRFGSTLSQFIVCKNPYHYLGIIPDAVTIVPFKGCPSKQQTHNYMPPYFPLRQPRESMAACTLISYGDLNAELMQEWIEVHSSLGIDKILTYTDPSLNENARTVLKYYKRKGIVEEVPYARVGGETFSPGTQRDKNWMNFQFAETIHLDCQQLLRGYKYVATIDWDEFVIPNNFTNLKTAFGEIFRKRKKAAALKLDAYYYIIDWGESNPDGEFNVTRYSFRTAAPCPFSPKHIFMPERLPPSSLYIHLSESLLWGVQWLTCPPAVAIVRHYRRCRYPWLVPDKNGKTECHSGFARVNDTTVIRYMSTIREKVLSSRQEIGIDLKV